MKCSSLDHRTTLLLFLSVLVPMNVASAAPSPKGDRPLPDRIDFERHVAPLLVRHGCVAGSCHGSSEGQGGFKLSLFGFDMSADYRAIRDEAAGRIDIESPESSLLLEKPTLRVDHEGGERFSRDSIAYRTIRRWIEQGAEHRAGSGALRNVRCEPDRVTLSPGHSTVRARVHATFDDGTEEDVTPYCEFRCQDAAVADVGPGGSIRRAGVGDTHVIAVYRGYPASVAVVSPDVEADATRWEAALARRRSNNRIDQLIVRKLRSLSIEPSPPADDVEFLRRVTLATIGQLPTPAEIRRFVADTSGDKRSRKIDALLAHPLHASLWATRMCEMTGSRDDGATRDVDRLDEWKWHEWFRLRFADNIPYDQVVRDVLLATTLEDRDLSEFVSDEARAGATADDVLAQAEHYARRRTLDLFWRRPTVNEDIDVDRLTERVSAALLGVRIECARCHKHPFDRWSQDDHRSMANVFAQVRFGISPESRSELVELLERQREARREGLSTETIPAVREVFVAEDPSDRVSASTGETLPPRPLGGPVLPGDGDRRAALADWLTDADNPMFARNFVNRVWKWYFGRGFVEPVDAFSAANPPSHPELLDALALEFARSGFDVRKLERTILTSRSWQQSSLSTVTNAHDTRNFARAYVTPLRAEVLLDAVRSATGGSFGAVEPAGHDMPAVAIPVARTGNPRIDTWFDVFRRPNRILTCDCEHDFEPTLRQTMLLLSEPEVYEQVLDGSLDRLIARASSDERLVEEMFLRTLSRWPDESESRIALATLASTKDRRAAVADILWGLLNTREFVTNH